MHIRKLILLATAGAALLNCSVDEGGKDKNAAGPSISLMKQLAGYWEADSTTPDGKTKESVIYKLTSGGTAVQEILFPGSSMEMVSMYHQDGPDLVMTHYCALGNQPTLVADHAPKTDRLVFNFADAGNLPDRNAHHMHQLILSFLDSKTIKHEWQEFKDGKPGEVHTMVFTRKG